MDTPIIVALIGVAGSAIAAVLNHHQKILPKLMALLLSVSLPPSFAQAPPRNNAYWLPYFAGTAGPVEYGADAAYVDAQGNVYIAGHFQSGNVQPLRVAKWTGSQWQILGDRLYNVSFVVAGGSAHAIAVDGQGNVYVGGVFNRAVNSDGSEVVAENIAKWNQATGKWEALGRGVDDDVFAIAIDNSNNVYVGGNLTRGFNPDGATVFIWRVGKWNAAQSVWEPLGEGVFGPGSTNVMALAIDANGDVFAGGDFAGVYNPGRIAVNASAIARWNGTSWSALGQNLTGSSTLRPLVTQIVVDNTNRVYVGGAIGTAINADGSTVAGPVVYWDGARWLSISSGLALQSINDLAVDGVNKVYLLYFAGGNTIAVDVWDGTTWTRLVHKSGFPSPTVIAANPQYAAEFLYMGGAFNEFESPPGTTIPLVNNARWDGRRWLDLIASGATGEVFAIASDNPYNAKLICFGGNFTSIGGTPASNIASFDGTAWDNFGGGVNGPVYAIAVVPPLQSGGVIVGGAFTECRNPDGSVTNVSNIAFWSFTAKQWLALGNGVDGSVYALALGAFPFREVFAGGAFANAFNPDASGLTVNHVARWDFQTGQWQSLGAGVGSFGGNVPVVRALAFGSIDIGLYRKPISQSLFVGGAFRSVTDPNGQQLTAANIARWDAINNRWLALGGGVDDEVLVIGLNKNLFSGGHDFVWVGGRFRLAFQPNGSNIDASRIVMWAGDEWRPLGRGVDAPVRAIDASNSLSQVYVGGDFIQATNGDNSTQTANHIASFTFPNPNYPNGGWLLFGDGTDNTVHALQYLRPCVSQPDEVVYAGGEFTIAGNKTVRGVAKWKYPFPPSGGRGVVHIASSSRSSGGGSRKSGGVLVTSLPSCSPLGKAQAGAEEIIFENLDFRESRAISNLPFDRPFRLRIYASDNPSETFVELDSVETAGVNPFLFTLVGVNDTAQYAPNPDGRSIASAVLVQEMFIVPKAANEVQVTLINAVTDAPALRVAIAGGATLTDNLGYGESSFPINVSRAAHTLNLLRASDGQALGTFSMDVSAVLSGVATVLLSGFLDPAANQNGPALGVNVFEIENPLTAVAERDEGEIPTAFHLAQNYPNPFNPVTSIQYAVNRSQLVSLKVYDVLGKEVAILVNARQAPGNYQVVLEAKNLPSGIYFYQLRAGGFVATRKLLLVR